MGVKLSASYVGQKRVQVQHGPSGQILATDAPLDNNGKGESFSPTDLVAAALGSCAMTMISIVAEKKGINLEAMEMEVEKSMNDSPRRIQALPVSIKLPSSLTADQRKLLEASARSCPVAKSISEEIEAPINFSYMD